MQLTESRAMMARAKRKLVGGVNSPVRAFGGVERDALIVSRASGPYLWDVDNNRYLDFIGSFGPLILGHAHPDVTEALAHSARNGLTYGATCVQEIELAEGLSRLMPHLERVRFVSSGTEATMSALRLARGATKREKFLKFAGCYHGHADAYLTADAGSGVATLGLPGSAGVTQGATKDTLSVAYNDLQAAKAVFARDGENIAAVIVEPIACNMGLVWPQEGFLSGLRQLCDTYGALLIFDEVITGLRIAKGGASSLFGVTPDITTLGKIVGGGLPVGAYGGRADLMEQIAPLGPIYQAGTLSGNPLSMTAGKKTLELLCAKGFYEDLEHKGALLEERMQAILSRHDNPAYFSRAGSIFHLWFAPHKSAPPQNYDDIKSADAKRFSRFFAELLHQGFLIAPSAFEVGFLSHAHTHEHIEAFAAAVDVALEKSTDATRTN